MFEKILKEVRGPLNVGVYYLNNSAPDFANLKQIYKLGNKFPQMKFYKNNIYGDEKLKNSYEVYHKKFDEVMDEIHDGIESEVKEVTEKILNSIIVGHAVEDKKHCIIYFYNDDRISLDIKALSAFPIIRNDYVFIAVYGPSEETLAGFQVKTLPGVAGVIKAEGDDISSAKQFNYQGPINFDDLLSNFLKLADKEDEYNN